MTAQNQITSGPVRHFARARVWQFATQLVANEGKLGTSGEIMQTKGRSRSVGVVADSLDAALAALREKYPDMLIRDVIRHDIPIDMVVGSPETHEVAEKLGWVNDGARL